VWTPDNVPALWKLVSDNTPSQPIEKPVENPADQSAENKYLRFI
jgi:hypothetical protein